MSENNKPSVSLQSYLESLIDGIKENVKTAYASMEKRLDGMNEFRATLKDQEIKYVTRSELNALMKESNTRIEATQKMVDELKIAAAISTGKASQQSVNIAFIIAATGTVIGIVNIILKFAGK